MIRILAYISFAFFWIIMTAVLMGIMMRLDDEWEEYEVMLFLLCLCFWPVAIIVGIAYGILKLISLFPTKIALFIAGFLAGIEEQKDDKESEWINSIYSPGKYMCAKCGYAMSKRVKYCPDCGRKMKNESD